MISNIISGQNQFGSGYSDETPQEDEKKKQIDNVVLFFLAILYSIVFVVCTARVAPYLLVFSKEETEIRKQLVFDKNNQVIDEEEDTEDHPALNHVPEPKTLQTTPQGVNTEDNESPLIAQKLTNSEKQTQQQERTRVHNRLYNQFRKIKMGQLKEQGSQKRPPEFKAFFWMNWIQLLLVGFLYWWAAINLSYWTGKGGARYTLAVIIMRYIPSILLTIQYMLLYFQMEQLFILSRLQSSVQIQSKHSTDRIIKKLHIFSWSFVGIFVVVEFMLIAGVLFGWIEKRPFEIQITSLTGFIILCLNVSMMILYYRYAGMPYKSEQHYLNLKRCGYIVVYWTFAFSLKFITAFIKKLTPSPFQNIDPNNEDYDTQSSNQQEYDSQSTDLFYAIVYFALNVICDIVPYLIVIDNEFIKIFTFDYITKFVQTTEQNQEIEHDNELQETDYIQGDGELKEELAMVDDSSAFENESRSTNPLNFMMTENTNKNNPDLSITELSIRAKVQFYGDLKIKDPESFSLLQPFERGYYNTNDKKFIQQKLGKLYNSSLIHSNQENKEEMCITRVIDFERISAYVVESFEQRMIKLFQIQNVENFWLQPISYYIDDKQKVLLFYPKAQSLYDLLHNNGKESFTNILEGETLQTRIRIKYEIAFQIGKILLTIHNLSSLKHHGHITSHNVFVDIRKIAIGTFEVRVRISDVETFDFMEYGNIFFNYRITSVWSSPEALKQMKKISELNTNMDIYSFGMVLWELWHEAIPFDNDIKQAAQYVLKEESRPKIVQSIDDIDVKEVDEDDKEKYDTAEQTSKKLVTFCDPIVSNLIRKCWSQNPNHRPKAFEICQLLQSKINKDLSQDIVIVKS